MLEINNLPPQLFAYLGLNNLSPEEQAEILGQISEVISNRVLEKLLDQVDLDTADKIAGAFTKNDGETLHRILTDKIPNLAELIAQEITVYVQELTAELKK